MIDAFRGKETPHPWVAAGQWQPRFGVAMVGERPDWSALFEWVRVAEALGFDSYWTPDHPTILPDTWTTLAALAVQTRRIRLGTLVSCAAYRHPLLLARLATDIDRLSQGRFVLGLGIGDMPHEFEQLDIAYGTVRERLAALEDTIRIVYGVWEGAPFTYRGQHFRVEDAQMQAPLQQPRVPLLIGGAGERTTLRQVALYADVTNFGPHDFTGGASSPRDVARKLEVLRRHCDEVGRPYQSILRTHYVILLQLARTRSALQEKVERLPQQLVATFRAGMVAATPDEAVAYYQALADAGMQYFIAAIPGADAETLHLFGEHVLPRVRLP